jgi:dipeptidase E
MRLLWISNSTNFGENYLAWATTQIELFCLQNQINKDSRIIFVPFAGVNIGGKVYPESYDAYEARVKDVFLRKLGLENFTSVHHFEDKVKAVREADCIVVGGGNTFHLVAEMHRYGLMDAIRERALAGVPYMGWSAGSNVACPTLCTTNDMPIVQPASFKCLNLVPFQINPHYLDPHPEIDKMIKHGGETRQDRINEYLAVNQNMTVVGLREATALWVINNQMLLKGGKKMIVMRYCKDSVEIEPNSGVTFLLERETA